MNDRNKERFRRLFAGLTVLALLLTALPCFVLPAHAESLYIRKIVSVVYDDSGSMAGDKAAFAGYAMQTFCGMLNSEDQLYVTYMSDRKTVKVDLSSGSIQSSVEMFNDVECPGNTPFETVGVAFDRLKSVDDPNPNTQYWLVVFTDGQFNSGIFPCNDTTLTQEMNKYLNVKMPNDTTAQVIFLAFGQKGDVSMPASDEKNGLYSRRAEKAEDIISAMDDMADRISGRTRLSKSDIKSLGGGKVQISSAIPLLNIAVLAQETDAVIEKAVYADETPIPVTRTAKLRYDDYDKLRGGAFLIGDSATVIGAGTYIITFNKDVNVKNVAVLFEPALEMRAKIKVNGKEIGDIYELEKTEEGDTVSVSCKIYEMGTDNEIDPSRLPTDTKYSITLREGDTVKKSVSGKQMQMDDVELSHTETELEAAVEISGFNPIKIRYKFTPDVHKVVYTVTAEHEGNYKAIKYNKVGTCDDVKIVFRVLGDGVPVTDPDVVRAMSPEVTLSSSGDAGSTEIRADGAIVFLPTRANTASALTEDEYDVTVTCRVGEAEASEKYTVIMAEYAVVFVGTGGDIVKTRFYGNTIGASFYITKDGEKLSKKDVEGKFDVRSDAEKMGLKIKSDVAQDGTVTLIPYDENERVLDFRTWWGNWWYYLFGTPDGDVNITCIKGVESASARIGVAGETTSYVIKNVVAPLAVEILILVLTVYLVIVYTIKPRYAPNAVLYVGNILYNPDNHSHFVDDLQPVKLKKFNTFEYLWWPIPKVREAKADGIIRILPAVGGRITVNENFPWYCGAITPYEGGGTTYISDGDLEIRSPDDVIEYIDRHNMPLEIEEISAYSAINADNDRTIPMDDCRVYVVPSQGGIIEEDDRKVIDSGTIFIYSTSR